VEDVKGLVLAGGSGTRLRPITFSAAKQLVPIANTPILIFGLRQLADVGIREVGVVVGETADEIRTAVGDGSAFGLHVTYLRQEAPLGLAHALLLAEPFLAGDDVLMFLGDNLVEGGLDALVAAFELGRPAAQLLLKRVATPERFGVAELGADGNVLRLVEKPLDPPSDLALVGAYVLSPRVVAAAHGLQPSARGELELTDALQRVLDDGGTIGAIEQLGWWLDTGKKDDLLDANRTVLAALEHRVAGHVDAASVVHGPVVVEAGARVERAQLRGPVVIGVGTHVLDATVGPFVSLGAGGVVARSVIEHSVVMERCRIQDAGRLEGCLLGRDVTIRGRQALDGHRLVLGDRSELDLAAPA